MCNGDLKSVLKKQRDKHAKELLTEFDEKVDSSSVLVHARCTHDVRLLPFQQDKAKIAAKEAADAAEKGVAPAEVADVQMGEDEEALQAALAMSMDQDEVTKMAGPGLPENFRCVVFLPLLI
jgi:hypothetical protein